MFNIEHLNSIRAAEVESICCLIPQGARTLEIGGGTGQQARMLAARGVDIVSVDIEGSVYREDRIFDVIDYDGRNLPFPDDSFDVVLSSNVLEHVVDLKALLHESARVLRPGGFAIHIMPTHTWRIWTSISHYADLAQKLVRPPRRPPPESAPHARSLRTAARSGISRLGTVLGLLRGHALPPRHGERGNVISEIAYFRPAWWRRCFREHGYTIVEDYPMGLFYTGYMVLGSRLSMRARRRLARVFGSACHLFRVVPAGT